MTPAPLIGPLITMATASAAPMAMAAMPRGTQVPVPPLTHTDPAAVVIPEAGQISKLLQALRISEPAMLALAELVDTAATDLLTDAIGKVSRRNKLAVTRSRRRR